MELPLRGIIPPLATPLLEDPGFGEPKLDVAGLERLIEHVIAGEVHGVFLLGTTGEFPSLSRQVREEITRRAASLVNRRVPVLVGVSDTSLTEILRFADVACESGADGLVLAPPYYFQHSQADLLFFLERLSAHLSLPLFLYNIPSLTKTSFEPETVLRAAQIEGIAGLKDSSGDLGYLARALELLRDRPGFSVLLGPEELFADGLRMGAHGGVCGGANLSPALFVGLYKAMQSGDEECATRLQQRVVRMGEELYRIGDPGGSYLRGIKAALALAGICRPEPAPPFAPFTRVEFAAFKERYRLLESAGYIVPPSRVLAES